MKKAQKTKRTAKLAIIAAFAAAVIAIACIIAIINNLFASHQYGNYQIPTGYTNVVRDNKSATDGPDVTYYIYPDKVICETKNYLPVDESRGYTKTRTVVIYDGATNVEETAGKTGKEVANEHD